MSGYEVGGWPELFGVDVDIGIANDMTDDVSDADDFGVDVVGLSKIDERAPAEVVPPGCDLGGGAAPTV